MTGWLKRCLNFQDKRCIIKRLVESMEKGAYLSRVCENSNYMPGKELKWFSTFPAAYYYCYYYIYKLMNNRRLYK